MSETIEKAKLVAGVPFHLTDPVGALHFKRSFLGYTLGFPMAEGSLVDDSKDPWADGNFLLETRGTIQQGDYRVFDVVVLEVPEVPGLQEAETIYCKVVNTQLKPWDEGNIERIRTAKYEEEINGRVRTRIVQTLEPCDVNAMEFWKLSKIGADGKATEVLYGRQKRRGEGPWATGNFEVFLPAAAGEDKPRGWKDLDFNADFPEQTWKKERVGPKFGRKSGLDKSKQFAIRFRENFSYTNWQKETTIDRDFLLSTGPTLWKLIEEKIKSKVEDGNDPCQYWLTLGYTEKARGEGVDAPPEVTYTLEAKKMTEDEIKALPVETPKATVKRVPAVAQEEVAPHPAEDALFNGNDDIKLDEIAF